MLPMTCRGRIALAATVLLSSVAAAQSYGGARPIQTTLCELAQTSDRFNGKIVAVRGPVQIAFEDFSFSVAECGSRKVDGIWLEYGRGPKHQPTTWCCGDLTPSDP